MLSERSRPKQVSEVIPTVAGPTSDRPCGSLAYPPTWAGIATGGDPIPGWPPVELPTPSLSAASRSSFLFLRSADPGKQRHVPSAPSFPAGT